MVSILYEHLKEILNSMYRFQRKWFRYNSRIFNRKAIKQDSSANSSRQFLPDLKATESNGHQQQGSASPWIHILRWTLGIWKFRYPFWVRNSKNIADDCWFEVTAFVGYNQCSDISPSTLAIYDTDNWGARLLLRASIMNPKSSRS